MILYNKKSNNMQFNFTLKKAQGFFSKPFLAFLLLCFLGSSINAQTYVNGNLSTGATSSNGIAAPTGYTWSEVQTGNTTGGVSASITNNFKLADNFVVPAGATWNLTSMKFYGYQTGFVGTVSPFTTIRVAIHSGTVTGPVVFGDQTTNRLASSPEALMYRIFTATPGTTRTIWAINANTNVTLTAGTYWVEYATDVTGNGAHFLPPSTVVGTVTQAGNNAQQWTGTAWVPLVDGTNVQDMPFSVNYTTTCIAPALPTVTASATTVCANSPVTLTASGALNNAANWEFYTGSCGGTVVGTGNSITVSPAATTTYYVRGVGGCPTPGACSSITITTTPCTCLTPDVATICEGLTQRIAVTGAGIPGGPSTVASGPITVNVPDANTAGITTPLTVALPAGASITSMSVNFNMTHTFDGDMTFNLVAPNGAVYNLVNRRGGAGDDFVNTTISSTSLTPISGGTAPFTGTFSGDGALGAGSTGFPSTVATFSGLYSVPNGTWRLDMRDHAGLDVGILTSWRLTFNYVILPTATWSGPAGTLFSNAAGTTAYVAGTQANAIWVTPTVTSTYVATIVGGPCAGANNSVITVLPRPVVSVIPTTGCSPLTITASGANTYAWTPAAGLNTTSAAVVIANPTATTTYSVTGTGTNGCAGVPVTATVSASPTAAVISAVAGSVFQIQEGFTTVLPTGWARQNLSSPLGAQNWGQGLTAVFNSFNGAATAYAHNNFNATTGDNTISSWMFTPTVNIKNGDVISFYTRTQDPAANGGLTFPDRLELRMSTNGASVNAGTTNLSVGDFTTLILTVNPTLTNTGYPFTWTQYTATISGVTGTVSGRFAFRYFVTNGGSGANSDNIGVDQVEYFTPSTANCANVTTNLKIDVTGGVGPFTVVYTNGTAQTTINNYVSGSNIQVSPAVTTTYSIVSVTGANGCTAPAATGTATVAITPPASVTTQPTSQSASCGSTTTFAATLVINAPVYQWQVQTTTGGPWVNLTNLAPYSGVTTNTLTINPVATGMTGYNYRLQYTGSCSPAVNYTNVATLTVTPIIALMTPPTAAVCLGAVQQLSIANISSPAPGSLVVNSPTLNLNVIDNNPAGVNNSITIPALPAGAVVTGVRVKLNVASTWVGDLNVNLKGPNNLILNLSHNLSVTNGNAGGGGSFVNTVIGSAFTTPLHTATSPDNPHTGNYKADAGTATVSGITPNITGFVPTLTSWNSFFTSPSGTWTIAIADIFPGGDVTTFQNWSLTIDYLFGAPVTGVFNGPTGTMFTNAAATTPYTGTVVNTIYVKPTVVGVNNYSVVITDGACTSLPLTIPVTVNTPVTGSPTLSNAATCVTKNASFTVGGTLTGGPGFVHQYQVSTDNGATYTNVVNGGVYSGATTNTLTLTAVPITYDGYRFRDSISTPGNCGSLITTVGVLTVNPEPTVTISAAPIRNLFPGLTSTLTAAVNPAPTGSTYQWFRNGVAVTGATNNPLVVGIDALGTYTVRVVNGNGCVTTTTTATPFGSQVIGDSANLTTLFAYPSPNRGQFQVRYYNAGKAASYVNIYDEKGSLVYSKQFGATEVYQAMNVDLGIHGKGIYRIDVLSASGNRINTGSVTVF
jgi:subtilisin-like proprotein convertase family protein